MITLQGTYLTSDKAKDGTSFSIGAMFDAVWQGSNGGTPTNMTHDIHRTIGWTLVNSLYLTPLRASVIGKTYLVESDEEIEWLKQQRLQFFHDLINKGLSSHKDTFLQLLRDKGLTSVDEKNLTYNGIAICHSKGIATNLFPELKNKESKGLVYLSTILKDFKYIGQGVFLRKWSDLCILVHPYLRKSQSYGNNYNLSFLEQFFSLIDSKDVSLRIRIDEDVVGYAPSYVESHEYEYWYHPQYDDDIASIPSGLVSLKTTDRERIFNQVDHTEFEWKSDADEPQLKTLEVEEVIEQQSPVVAGEFYPCRYIHAQYDIKKSQFVHFDGAIRGYTFDEIIDRLEKPMTECGRHTDYTKLFRIDGKLSIDKWKMLITQFYNGNSQVLEYFKAELPNTTLQQSQPLRDPILNYVPCMMTEDDGVSINISLFDKKPSAEPRFFDSVDEYKVGNKKYDVVESCIIDVKKMLCRQNAPIDLPKDVLFADINDCYVNIPLIAHGDNDTQNNVNATMAAIGVYVQQLKTQGKDMVYSFSMGFNTEDRHVVISFVGHVNSLTKWMKSCKSIPVDTKGLRRWVDEQYKNLGRKFNPSSELLKERFIRDDGMLYISRVPITNDATLNNIYIDDGTGSVNAQVEINDGNIELVNLFNSGKVVFAGCHIFKNALCTKGKCSYLDSPYIAVLNETTVEVQDLVDMTIFWTNNH